MKICCKCIYARTTEYDDIVHKTIRRSKILHVLAYEKSNNKHRFKYETTLFLIYNALLLLLLFHI